MPHEPYPRRIQRFLEPCLLLLLHDNEIHGYELAEVLKPFGFEQNPVDSRTFDLYAGACRPLTSREEGSWRNESFMWVQYIVDGTEEGKMPEFVNPSPFGKNDTNKEKDQCIS
jgi:hypothetical protein